MLARAQNELSDSSPKTEANAAAWSQTKSQVDHSDGYLRISHLALP